MLKTYAKIVLIRMQSQMEYKLSFFLTLFGQFLTAFAFVLGLYFVFERVKAIDAFTFPQVLLCYAVVMTAFSVGELFGGGFATFPKLLGNGEFDRALVRPCSPIAQILAGHVDFTRLGLTAQAAVTLVYAIRISGVTWTADKILTLILTTACGAVLFWSLFMLYAACAFFTTEGLDFLNILTYGARNFGKYPYSVYGTHVLRFLTFAVPLALVQYYPIMYVFGIKTGAFYMLSPLLSLLFTPVGVGVYRLGLRKYKSTGS